MRIKKKYYLLLAFLIFFNSLYAQEKYKADNVVTLTKLIGVVKYFYPAESIKNTDWNNFTRYALINIKNIKTNRVLKDTLNKLFRNVAPALNVLFKNEASVLQKNIPDIKNNHKIKYWEHNGYGYDRKEFSFLTKLVIPWKSKLVTKKLHKQLTNVPIPDSIYIFSLNDSLICAMPLCVTVKRNVFTKADKIEFTANNDKIEQFSALISIWNVIQHFHVYLDDTGYDWERFLYMVTYEINKGISNKTFENLIRKSLAKLNDRHIMFRKTEKKNFQIYKYKYEVLPIDLILAEDKVVVSKINSDSINVNRGDIITAINGESIDSVFNIRFPESDKSRNIKRKKLYTENLLYKYLGDKIELKIENSDTSFTKLILIKKKESKKELIQEIENGYFYIELSLMSKSELKENLNRLINAKGIIVDSRYRTGRAFEYFISLITDKPVNSGNWYSPTFRYPNRKNIQYKKVKPWTIHPDKKRKIKAPVVFLSGHNCLSRGESNLEIVKHYKLGEIIGESTAGVNGDVSMAYIDESYVFIFTQLLVLNRDNSVFFAKGIYPDIQKSPTIEDIIADKDYLVKYALNYLKMKKQ